MGYKTKRASWDDVAGVRVARVARTELHESVWTEIVRGLREGVGAHVLDGYVSRRGIDSIVLLDEDRERRELLERELADAKKKEGGARDLAAGEEDVEVQDGYKRDARRYAERARSAREQIAALDARKRDRDVLPVEFESEAEYLIEGLRTLLLPREHMNSRARAALASVLTDFRADVDDQVMRWSANLVVPADGRAVTLGPFTGTVPNLVTRKAPAHRKQAAILAKNSALRRDRLRSLVDLGFSKVVAAAAADCPFDELFRLLHGEEPDWDEVGAGFDGVAFNTHERETWRNLETWGQKQYLFLSPQRQELVDLVAALGGVARIDQLCVWAELRKIRTDRLAKFSCFPSDPPSRPRLFPSVLHRRGEWVRGKTISERELVSIRCPRCGEPATGVTRVACVPGALMCRACFVAPALPGLQYPRKFGDLWLPPTVFDPRELERIREGGMELPDRRRTRYSNPAR
jgi:hypothetical protein